MLAFPGPHLPLQGLPGLALRNLHPKKANVIGQSREERSRIFDARRLLENARASDKAAKTYNCTYCQDTLQTPHWYCVDCEGKTRVCMKCKAEQDGILAHDDETTYSGYVSTVLAGRRAAVGSATAESVTTVGGSTTSAADAVPVDSEAPGPAELDSAGPGAPDGI